MDQFNTPWRVTSAAIYTTPTDSRVYGTLDIDVTDAKRFLDKKRSEGLKITMTHLATAVLARAVAFDVPEMNCFIRRGAVVGRERLDVMVPVSVGGDSGVTPAIIKDAHARSVTSIAEEIRDKASSGRAGEESRAAQNKYMLNRIPWPLRRPAFLFLKWITVDMGVEIKSARTFRTQLRFVRRIRHRQLRPEYRHDCINARRQGSGRDRAGEG